MEVAYISVTKFRNYLLDHSKYTIFTRGDTRFKDTRYCGVCGRPLVKYIPKRMVFATTCKCYKLKLPNGNEFMMCNKAQECRDYRRKRKAGENVRVIDFSSHE